MSEGGYCQQCEVYVKKIDELATESLRYWSGVMDNATKRFLAMEKAGDDMAGDIGTTPEQKRAWKRAKRYK
jgi:hypothetical protein